MADLDRRYGKQSIDEGTAAELKNRESQSGLGAEQRLCGRAAPARRKGMRTRFINRFFLRYLVAAIAVALSFLVREAIVVRHGELPPFITFYPFVLLVAILEGIWAGLLATAFFALAAAYWVLPQLAIHRPSETVDLTIFCTTGICVSVVAELYNRKREKLGAANAQLRAEIAEREQVEEALRLSEEKFARAFANTPTAVAITRLRDGVFLEVNDTCAELVGYSREEMIGHSSRRMIWPTRDAAALGLRKLREKGWLHGWKQEFVKKSGEVFLAELSAQIWILHGKKLVIITLVDITARHWAEQALRDSEGRFRAFFETAAAGTAEVDLHGRFIQVNQHFCQITGYSREELLRMTPADLTHPADRDRGAEQMAAYLQGRLPIYDSEKRYLRKDGSVIWVHVTAAMIRDSRGNLLHSAGIIQDITERKRAEQDQVLMTKVLRVWNRADDLPKVISEALGLVKESTGFDAVGLRLRHGDDCPYYQQDGFSDAFLREENFLCGRGRDGSVIRDSYGHPVWECACGVVLSSQTDPSISFFTEGGSFWTNHSSELLALGPETDPRKIPRNRCIHAGFESVALIPVRTGEQIIGLLQLNDHRPGQFTPERIRFFEGLAGNLGLALQRQRAQDELRSNEARLRLALEAANSGTWEWDLRTRKSKWSYETWKLYGLDPCSCEPGYESWLSTIHPEDREMAQHKVKETIERRTELNLEYRVLDWNGGIRWLVVRGQPCFENGHAVSYAGIAMDITEHKRAEQALIRSEKLASVGRMAATVAHEINNPLAAVTNLLFIVKEIGGMPELARQYLETAEEELNRIAHITRQSLGFYRESNSPSPTAVTAVLNSTIDLLKSKIKAKHAVIKRQWEGDLQLTAVASELRQVFSNLLSNSLDAIEEKGTITLRVSPAATFANQRYARVTIADNGTGISSSLFSHIFEPFFTTKGAVGTGLGLWVSKQIIDKHGGAIRVRSSTNGSRRGTTISILLPVQPAAPRQPAVA